MNHFLRTVGIFGFAALLVAASNPEAKEKEMAARVSESLARDSSYEMVSVREFWGDASYLGKCTNKNNPPPQPFTIYFEVLSNGSLGQLLFVPETPVAQCIKQHVQSRHFTKPPGTYVTRIEMSFK